MFSSADKAIAAIIFGIVFLLQTWAHVSIPGWLTPDNVTQVLAVVLPIVVYWIPNKPKTT